MLDIYQCDGKLFPDRFPLPLFSRNGQSGNRPIFSSGIRFFSVDKEDVEKPFYPEYPDVYPDMFISEEYSMLLEKDGFGVNLKKSPSDKKVFALISKYHFISGHFESLKNQLAKPFSNIQWLEDKYRGKSFDRTKPFEDTTQKISEPEISFLAKDNLFLIKWHLEYNYCQKDLFMAVTANDQISLVEGEYFYRLEVVSSQKNVAFGFGLGESIQTATLNSHQISDNFARIKRRKKERKYSKSIKINLEAIPFAADFVNIFPHYQNAMLLAQSKDEVASRAATDKFGYFAMWDQVYPARDFLLMGMPEVCEKSLRYIFNYPNVTSCMWVTFHLVISLNEYLAFTKNNQFLLEVKDKLIEFFNFSLQFTDEKTSLVKDTLVYGVDVSKELGLDGFFYAACVNSWYYNYCRCLENMFITLKEDKLATLCNQITSKIEKSYEDVFFNKKVGYLRSAVDSNFNIPKVEIFQNVNTIGVDYIYGIYLLRNIMDQLATYQATKLYHPLGHGAVATDSLIPCDMWRATHMNQHNGHECKVARLGGRPQEAFRVINGYMNRAKEYHTAIETFNLSGFPGNCVQTSNWQTFAATAAVQGMIGGVIGLSYHAGGLNYVPANFTGKHEISNFHFGKKIYSLKISGKGSFAKMTINGKKLKYSLQIPEDFSSKKRLNCLVKHVSKQPDYPVLLSALDLPILKLKGSKNSLSFIAGASVHAPIKIYSPRYPKVMVEEKVISVEWNQSNKTAWFDCIFQKGNQVKIILE